MYLAQKCQLRAILLCPLLDGAAILHVGCHLSHAKDLAICKAKEVS